ncbi:competence type IV pilus ATPase ComGA [Loigolactobacillus jiayinensis]|uniref:Competence type IV pilus ATPase ComGA n=1 Tax=Loigolactobacillus jiayinensis TaxID=2486016 RepID=A0ABW1RGG9_9LACO|nr:competence type IV pilus ATPase ComGA [Loigolactobacillus jiayinensis]
MSITTEVTMLLRQCIAERASDLYFLPYQCSYQLQMRTATGIELIRTLPVELAKAWLNHLKFTAKMALSETRRPQLGARQIEIDGQLIFLRLSAVGNFQNQESLVIRFIYAQSGQMQYVLPKQFSQLTALCQQRGLVVFAGPTGSGKTTTLYELAAQLGDSKMVMAIEDPIEIFQTDFLQLQVNEAAGMTYAALLKVGLRHRPDILIVGEIRDEQTANVAARAALSGHLVLSTVHARTARQVPTRLSELGIAPATLKACLTGVSYQRLLPTKAGAAVLFDIYDPTQGGNDNESTWQQNLARAVKLDQISLATQQAFKNG